ncbi:MAG TPA: GAF domain-containing protein, partial [Candidatus Sulfotelmatobacter sp.]|nr:GAF domain-containing protein [Candidatus Sulfotelmatobacter sp.]
FGLFTDITARKQAEEALARRTRHLEAVQAIGEEITRELDPPHLLDLILARAMELVGTGSGTLYRWDEAARVLVPATSRGLGDWYRSVRLELGQGVAGTVAQRRDALVVNDLPASPYVLPQLQALHPEAAEVRTSLGVPLLYQDRLLGVLLVRDKHTGEPFGEADVQILRLLAPAAAIAIENAHLYSVAQTHARQLARLTTLTRTLAAQLVPEQAIAEILAAVPALLPGAAARLRQRIGAGTEFRVAGTIGLRDAEAGAQGTVSAAEGLLRLAFASRTPIAATDVATDPDFAAKDWAVREGVVSALVVPLLRGDELVGSLGVLTHERHAFSDGEVALFQALADHAAIALENARLFDELNHSYGRLQQAQTELIRTEKLRALGQMGAGIAHDLNNMLAAILGQLDLLRLQVRDPQILEGLRTLETAATDGAKVVRRLQDFGRQRGQVPLAPVELETVVREALEMTRPRWRDEVQRQGHAIRVEARLEGLPPALSYAPELREALINLILNAVDAMPKGGSLRFAGRAAQQDGTAWVVLEVEDTGIGMTEAIRERIFDPFFTTKGPQGTGLGLSVVYGILERHGGRIDVVSAPGRGTTFTLRLRAAGSAASSQAEPGPAGSALSRRVLLIDDDPMVRETIAGLLRAGGHIVTEAGGGAEGLRTLADGIPDIVITDLGMPELTGWDVARKIKAAHPKLPIILLTGWGEQARDDSSADARAQVDRILGKPVRLDDLLRAVGQLCGIE